MTVFEAYITNLGKYAEGQLVGETLKFPATTEEVQSLLKNIGVDGVRYEEFFITAFDGDVMGLYDYLTEYENLDELNHLAHLISELDSDEIETLEAALNKGDHTSSVADIINLVHNLDCYELHPGVTDDETLGRIYVEDMELLDVPDNVLPYFDFEAYGRDMRINEGGHFAPTGYLTRSGDFKEVYHGIEDIPAEHRIFAYPTVPLPGRTARATTMMLKFRTTITSAMSRWKTSTSPICLFTLWARKPCPGTPFTWRRWATAPTCSHPRPMWASTPTSPRCMRSRRTTLPMKPLPPF